jgi:hypothetical protein
MILVFIWFHELRYQIWAFQGMTKWSWPNVKIIITTGVYLTRGPGGPDPRLRRQRCRPAGPTPWLVDQVLRWFGPILGCHASTWGGEARIGGGRSTRLASHVPWLVGHHLAPNQPLQVGGGPVHPDKYPLMVKVEIPHSTCSSTLVKVPV